VYNYPAQASHGSQASPGDIPPKLVGRIELKDVQFGYSTMEPPLIDGLSLALEPGMRIALVGGSGSGKSTVGRLVCGLCTPWAGEIRFDDRLPSEIPPQIFASSVAYVDQDIFLFDGTVRENLTLWDATISDIDISQALKDALIHDDITTRPGNYDCHVSEGGSNFSGGQRQRIEIARALVGNPSLIVLDEATGALDPVVEKEIDDNLRRRGCTCIIIAHRLSTIRDCDEIILLHQGKVAERGKHEELLARGGAYARLMSQE
jgi:ABC-type bacteriocin/lantibiotic exporter with double-glycine peptidase domain